MSNRCVLVCEGDVPVAQLTVRVLKHAGYDADHVCCLEDAKERLHSGNVDLLIVDAPFIDSDSCHALLENLRVNSPAEILFTTSGFSAFREADPRYTYVLKPWRPDTLLDAVRGLIGR